MKFCRASHEADQIDFEHFPESTHLEFAAPVDHRTLRQHQHIEPVERGLEILDRLGIADVELRVVQALKMRSLVRRIIGGGRAGAADMHARTLGPERLRGAVAAEVAANGGTAKAWRLDVANRDDINAVVNEISAHFGGLDIVVNNAGISVRVAIDDDGYDEAWAKGLTVMLTAHQRVIRAALPHLRKSKSPRIVNIASTEALGATALHSPYSAAKAGVVGLTRSLAVELGRDGITVNCICPGPILTGMTARIAAEHKAIYAKRRTALGRYGDPG